MKKIRYNFIDGDTILTILTACIILGAAGYTFYVFADSTDEPISYSETFTVSDSTVDQTLNTGEAGLTSLTVTQTYSNGDTSTISEGATGWELSGLTVTVHSEALT